MKRQRFCNLLITIAIILLIAPFASAQTKPTVKFGGALRFNYRYKDWDINNKSIGGDAVFDVFKISAKATYGKLFLDMDYRFYPSDFGGGMLRYGYIGYDFNTENQLQIGANQVPFGLLPYASHSWFFNLPYYVGLEDDYDMGIKFVRNTSKWHLALALYKNAEGPRAWSTFSNGTSGNSADPIRYSYDLAGDTEENGQINARAAYKFNKQEIGVSSQLGQYHNHVTDKTNSHNAFAIHYNGNFLQDERLNIKAEAIQYTYNGAVDDLITMAAYNYTYDITSKATLLTAGIAYTIPLKMEPFQSIQFYENYNYMIKGNDGHHDTQMNVIGCLLTAGPIYTYIDYASGKNQDWFGPWGGFGPDGDQYGLGRGEASPEWHSWFNINVGYYF